MNLGEGGVAGNEGDATPDRGEDTRCIGMPLGGDVGEAAARGGVVLFGGETSELGLCRTENDFLG